MPVRRWLRRLIETTGYTPETLNPPGIYDQDGLRSVHRHEFTRDPDFIRAYARGVRAAGEDYRWQWRIHIGLWAAFLASKLEGDFVECGVNRGFLSSAIMTYLSWDSLGKTFFLLDTFQGLDRRFVSEKEMRAGALKKNTHFLEGGFYVSGIDSVVANFAEWKNVRIVQGPVPETLDRVGMHRVAYLHLDMNCSQPEVAAARFFWDRLVPGAFILLDDYAFYEFDHMKAGMDAFAAEKGVQIASLPTGQGLLIKPAVE